MSNGVGIAVILFSIFLLISTTAYALGLDISYLNNILQSYIPIAMGYVFSVIFLLIGISMLSGKPSKRS
jgi:hypothetical protein